MNIDVSIVIPVYFNEGSLLPLMARLNEDVLTKNPKKSFEIIFVDDGSEDNSFEKLLEIKKQNPDTVKIIRLTRNFGQANATRAGIHHSKGAAVVILSADLQDPPYLINEMLHYHDSEGARVVICTRESRDESYYRKITSRFYYWLIRKLAFKDMPIGGFDYFLIDGKVRDSLYRDLDRSSGLKNIIFYAGYKPKYIYYKREKREFDKSQYNFGKKFNIVVNLVMNYSFLPIRVISVIGALTALVGFIWAGISLYYLFFIGPAFLGTRAIFVLILILSGLHMLMTGIIGEYLWRALEQIRNRPRYFIDEVID